VGSWATLGGGDGILRYLHVHRIYGHGYRRSRGYRKTKLENARIKLYIRFFSIYVYYTGYIVTDGVTFIGWPRFYIDFATKFEIFQYIPLFQGIFSGIGIYLLTSLIYMLYYKFFESKNQNG